MTAQTDAFAAAGFALAQALRNATNDPADQIRLLLPLCSFMPTPPAGSGPLWQTAKAAQDICAATLRVSACAALGQAALAYQPHSFQDAEAVRNLVCGAIDAEATRAADAERDATYNALRQLRTAVALDLLARGANLAWLVRIKTLRSTSSLAETWSLYADTSREPELVASAQPAHPGWLPTEFEALDH